MDSFDFVAWMQRWPAPVCVVDSAGDICRGNPAFQARWGNPSTFRELFDHSSRDRADRALAAAITDEWPAELYTTCRDEHGAVAAVFAWRITRIDGFAHALAHDVTREHAELAVAREQRERVDLAVRGANCGLWDWDVESGRVWRSPFVFQLLGFGPDDQIPDLFEALEIRLHPHDHERVQRAINAHLDEFEPYDIEYRLRAKDGCFRWFRSRGEALRDARGKPYRMTGSIIDIDAHKRVERDLQRARADADAANQAKSAFLANMSHEIRTPMNAILGYADLLLDDEADSATRADHVATIRRNGDHLLRVINDILDLSKIESNRMGLEHIPVDVPALIGEVLTTMRVRADERGLELSCRFASAIPKIIPSDPVRLRQILVNLIGNAVKFTERGHVRLVLAHDQLPDESPKLRIRVEDTGIGMSPEAIAGLFTPFSQGDASTTRRFGGSGLGLTISRRLARLFGGDIAITSRVGVGSAFDLIIPFRMTEDTPFAACLPEPESALIAAPLPKLSGRVLLAEDGLDNQRLISLALRKAGIEVEVAENGQLAVDRYAAGGPFDLILMDMQMPVLDGYSATRLLRAQGCDCPIIALTAHAMAGDRERCLDAGCTAYETKPVKRRQLLETLARYL